MTDFGIAVQDDGYRRALLDPSTLLDTPHHDVPERHEIGKALLTPGLPKPSGTASAGISPAPARADHVHGVGVSSPYPLGRIATGLATAPVAIPPSTQRDVTNLLNVTLQVGRIYRLIYAARAVGITVANDINARCRFVVCNSDNTFLGWFDHYVSCPVQYANCYLSQSIAGNGNTYSVKVRAESNLTTQDLTVYGTEWYMEDIGKV